MNQVRFLTNLKAKDMSLPLENLHIVPESIPDEVAVFTEPLAAALEIPVGTVESRLHRARRQLADLWETDSAPIKHNRMRHAAPAAGMPAVI